jgi:hypothetical protein
VPQRKSVWDRAEEGVLGSFLRFLIGKNQERDEEERLYQEELTRLRAAERARKAMLVQRVIGGGLGDVLEEFDKDRKAEAKARRRATFGEAWKERATDRIPFVRLRDLAPNYGLNLDPNDPAASNLAYRIEGELRQAAVNGELKVWGRKYTGQVNDNAPLIAIPASHFEDYSFAHGFLHYEVANDKTHTGSIPKRLEELVGQVFFDLHISLEGAKAVLRKVKDDEQE